MAETDWSSGAWEEISAELEPVGTLIVDRAAPSAADTVLDIACGDGNAALRAADRGARAIGVDSAPRLVALAAQRAHDRGLSDRAEFHTGDLMELPVADTSVDVAVSVFGLIFAPDPAGALTEAARVIAPGGRLLFTAWVPDGPIAASLRAFGAVLSEVTGAAPPAPFAWFDPEALDPIAIRAGLTRTATTRQRNAVRAASPEAYQDHNERHHPMAQEAMALLRDAGRAQEARTAMLEALRAGNEDPDAMLVHSPYVVHELRRG